MNVFSSSLLFAQGWISFWCNAGDSIVIPVCGSLWKIAYVAHQSMFNLIKIKHRAQSLGKVCVCVRVFNVLSNLGGFGCLLIAGITLMFSL